MPSTRPRPDPRPRPRPTASVDGAEPDGLGSEPPAGIGVRLTASPDERREAGGSPEALADAAVELVHGWLRKSVSARPDRDAARLAGLLKDPRGLEFTVGFVDRVMRPEDLRIAARELRRLSHRIPRFLPWWLRAAIAVGGRAGSVLPWPVIPLARRALRSMVGHLVIDASPRRLPAALARLREHGSRLNINLLGEAVLGDQEATRRLEGTRELLRRDDVDYVSVKVSSIVGQLSMWGFDETVDRVVDRLAPLYADAAAASSPTFINLDMEEYRDLDLTVAVFERMLDRPELLALEAGIVVQAYLPDALGALERITAWAQARRARGGAPVKVRLVKGANLAMERVDAALHDWPLATFDTKRGTDTNYLRLLDAAMTPERTDAVHVGVAGHNLFDIALAVLLARARGVEQAVDIEMLLGMATAQQEAVRATVGGLLLYTPVVQPAEFDAAIGYLVRRLEENAGDENFMSAVFDLQDATVFAREEARFRRSVTALGTDPAPVPHRRQDRSAEGAREAPDGFANAPDTDPAIAANRAWGRDLLARSTASDLGNATIGAARVTDAATLERRVAEARAAGAVWGERPAAERADVLDRIADALAAARGRLVEVMAAETGKTIGEADPEVSEAVDFARWYAVQARELDRVPGAVPDPVVVTVAVPPWNFPVSIPAGSILGPLAAGSAVLFKPAPQARRCGAVLAEAIWSAGVPRDLVALVDVEEGDLGRALIAHPAVGRVVLTGSWETAALFRSWRPDLPLFAETSGKNAIVITPSADLDQAVADVVRSAFSNAGQKCSAASLVILVGSVGRSARFARQLIDATRSLRVGTPDDPTAQVGPVIQAPEGKLLRGLTTLGRGESWLVRPERVASDATGRLWTPGIRTGVRRGSDFHLTEFFGPVLGVMRARTLERAIRLQNQVPYGLTAGLHSLDPAEIELWTNRVQAGNLYVNRGITGAIVGRQPFGGWKRSSVGGGAKAGGPNTLLQLTGWRPADADRGRDLRLDAIRPEVRRLIEAAEPGMPHDEFDLIRAAALRDTDAWLGEFGHTRELADLGVERNLLRYRPAAVVLRLAEGAPVGWLVRELAAATLTGSPVWVSTAAPLPYALGDLLTTAATAGPVQKVVVESDARFVARAARGLPATRVRLLGGDAGALAAAVKGDPDLAILADEVTTAGRVALLAYLREQSISLPAHRFGDPDAAMLALRL